jgi:hypothetical protein
MERVKALLAEEDENKGVDLIFEGGYLKNLRPLRGGSNLGESQKA